MEMELMATRKRIQSRVRFRLPRTPLLIKLLFSALIPVLFLLPLPGFTAWAQQETPTPTAAPSAVPGASTYRAHCAQCHGEEGDGRGHAFDYTVPRPRDFSSALFKFRNTDSGEYPTRDNLIDIISRGMPGTAMPPWSGVLSDREIAEAAGYVERFYLEEDDEKPEARPVGEPPPSTPERIVRGRELFVKLECTRCHGNAGRGDGASSMTLMDDWNGEPIHPRDLTAGWLFRGGHEPRDIYRTVMNGLNGTPMPAHGEEELLADEANRWDLVHYVRSLGPGTAPEVKSTLVAKWVDGKLPDDSAHKLWNETREYYIPLAGQVVLEPRWFLPSVRHLWVRALYNTDEIALRLRWTDATSMDNDAYKGALEKATGDNTEGGAEESVEDSTEGSVEGGEEEGDEEVGEGEEAAAEAPTLPPPPDNPVDELTVQFPVKFHLGDPLPYFLMGRPGKPVRLWVWRSDREGAMAAKTSRFGNWASDKRAAAPAVAAAYKDGQYTLTLKNKRTGAGGPDFPADPGLMPVSFSVADGFKREGGPRRGVATWYTLLLERPPGMRVIWMPLLVVAVLAALEGLLLRRVRRSPSEPETNGEIA